MRKKEGAVYYGKLSDHFSGTESDLARMLLKQAFSDFFCRDLKEEEILRRKDGKPYYKPDRRMHFNISHCQGAAAAAVSYVPVGVDVERMRKVHKRVVRKCCSEREMEYVFAGEGKAQNENGILSTAETGRFLRIWTLKESYVKMTGEGLRKPLKEVSFLPEETEENGLWKLNGSESDCRHYSRFADHLFLALTVEGENVSDGFGMHWIECRF